MDPVTHAMAGYVLSNTFQFAHKDAQNRFTNHAFTISIVLAAVSPDIDFIARYIGGSTLYFMTHRTITHSPFILIGLAILCSSIIHLLFKKTSFLILLGGSMLGAASHLFLDLTNVYSTMALWPFTNQMFSLNLISFMDLFFIGLLAFSILLSLLKPLRKHRAKVFLAVIIIFTCYLGVRYINQQEIKSVLVTDYNQGKLTGDIKPAAMDNIAVMAGTFGTDQWNFIVENDKEFIKGTLAHSNHSYRNVLHISKSANNPLVQRVGKTPLGKYLGIFSPFLDHSVTVLKKGALVQTTDLRFSFRINGNKKSVSHLFGGYTLFDDKSNIIYWGVQYPPKELIKPLE